MLDTPTPDRERWRAALLREREGYLRLVGRAPAATVPGHEEQATAHPAGTERVAAPDLRERVTTLVALIDDAIRRLDEGTFGFCMQCGRPIEPARLEIVPYTTMCASCRRTAESLAGPVGRSVPPKAPMEPGASRRTGKEGRRKG